jgi:CubicO group peptidase (beta-lactamase class C family)
MLRNIRQILITLTLFIACLLGPFPITARAQLTSENTAKALDDFTAGFVERRSAIERVIEKKRKEEHVPGVALAIVKDNRIIFLDGFGLRDIEHDAPVTVDTLFEIGSATKAFTAMAAMISVEEGKLSLEDPPRKYLPYFRLRDPEADSKVIIRDLLSHRTGLAEDDDGWIENSKLSREEVIKAVMLNKPTADQNLGYVVLCNPPNANAKLLQKDTGTIVWENLLNKH